MNTIKKFEFTGETRSFLGRTIHRIRALADFQGGFFFNVKAGDLGGWLEKEENLSQYGNAWVYGDARVGDNARIYGNALVGEDACVYGDARVGDNARIYGNVWISGDTWIGDDAVVKKYDHYLTIGPIGSREDITTFFRNADGTIKVKCGCFVGTIDEFLEKVTETHSDNKHARVYRAAAALAIEQIDATPMDEKSKEAEKQRIIASESILQRVKNNIPKEDIE